MKGVSLYRMVGWLALGILSVAALYFGRVFFIPFFLAIILTLLLLPFSRKLEKWGINRVVATLLSMTLVLVFLAGLVWVIAAQAASFSEDLPQIQVKLQQLTDNLQHWIQQQFGVSPERQLSFVREQISKFAQSANQYMTAFLSGSLGIITSFVLVMLYMFFFLWQREKYKNFLLKLFAAQNTDEVKDTLHKISKVSAQYVRGRLWSMLFLAVFYSIGFSVLGMKDAILMSIIAVLPTIIPYLGAYIGALFPLLMVAISGEPNMLLPAIAILIAAQVIDNNIIEPVVMGAALHLNPLFTILAIVLGELIWGLAGMILFEPLMAIIMIVCQHIPKLHAYAYVMQAESSGGSFKEKIKGLFSKNKNSKNKD